MGKSHIPASYNPATWRYVSPVDPETENIAIAFNCEHLPLITVGRQSEFIIRLQIPIRHAEKIALAFNDYIAAYRLKISQSPISGEMPSVAESTPLEGSQV